MKPENKPSSLQKALYALIALVVLLSATAFASNQQASKFSQDLTRQEKQVAAQKALRSPGIGAVLEGATFANYTKQPNFRQVNDIVLAYGARPHKPGERPYLELEEEGSVIILKFAAFTLRVDRNERYFHNALRRDLERAAAERINRIHIGMLEPE
ncbi:MAG TPA: hypothetical protein VLA04_03315 [Verrucomicrobiae bacterium]|nr:hypothetical protein [Verrucomicrobiae bacterium]